MKNIVTNFRVIILLMVSMSVSVSGFAMESEQDRLIEQVLDQSGYYVAVNQIPQTSESTITLLEKNMAKQHPMVLTFMTFYREAFKENFDTQKFAATTRSTMKRMLDLKTLRLYLNWLESDLGRKVTRLETQASQRGLMEDIQRFVEEIQKTPPSSFRLDMAKRLEIAIGLEDFSRKLWEQEFMSSALAVDSTKPRADQIGEMQLRNLMKDQMAKLDSQFHDESIFMVLFLYREMSELELANYLVRITNAELQHAVKAMNVGILKAFKELVSSTAKTAVLRMKGT